MSAISDLQTLTDEREILIIRLAEMAGILRDVRAAGAAEPVLPASTWHRLLVAALRASTARAPWAERRAA